MVTAYSDIQADLDAYCDFDVGGGVAHAKLYIVAARRWLQTIAESSSNQSSSMSMGKQHVADMLQRAQDYVAANATTSSGAVVGVRFLGVGSSFR